MSTAPHTPQRVSRLHALWLLVFAWAALDTGPGLSHQLEGGVIGIFLTVLVVTEIRSPRQPQHR